MKSITATMILICALVGCQTLDSNSTYDVDIKHLIRSAYYTQQELLKLELNANQEQPQRYDVLINSYCDLIDRGYINAPEKPDHCYSYTADNDRVEKEQASNQQCATLFHRCFKNCSLKGNDCMRCEEEASRCLQF
jgi:hypothetical protein